jgi:serine/threonine protein phosphatase PrpC
MTLQLQKIQSDTHKGHRSYQEDRLFTSTMQEGTLLAVLDGHGGDECSHFASEELPGIFADEIGEEDALNHVPDVLKDCIHKLNIMTQHMGPGSTLSLAFIPAKGDVVTCAVIGDSPIIIKDADGKINIGPEHNVRTNYIEMEAARARGGFVEGGYLFQSYDGMGLQMARALGDSHLSKVLSRVPDIYEVKVNAESFVIVASDGAFDPGHYDFKKAAQTVVESVEKGATAADLVKYAAVDYPTGDNVSVILARFVDEA